MAEHLDSMGEVPHHPVVSGARVQVGTRREIVPVDPRLRDLVVRRHALGLYDQLQLPPENDDETHE